MPGYSDVINNEPTSEKRRCATKVFFSEEEFDFAKARALCAGLALPEFMRGLALGKAPTQAHLDVMRRMRRSADPVQVQLLHLLNLVAVQQHRIGSLLNSMRDECPSNWDAIEHAYLHLHSILSEARAITLAPHR